MCVQIYIYIYIYIYIERERERYTCISKLSLSAFRWPQCSSRYGFPLGKPMTSLHI